LPTYQRVTALKFGCRKRRYCKLMFYWSFRLLFSALLNLLFKLKVEGLNNLPQKTNFIMVANHASYMDALVVMVLVPRKIHCIALRDLYQFSWLVWFLKGTEALPSGCSSEKASCLLAENKIVGLFPEGGVSHDGKLREFRRGAALLALKTGRPIVPCAIIGTFEALPRQAKFPRLFKQIKLKIGRPVYLLKEFQDLIDDIYMQEGTLKIRNSIEEMIYAG
jgi:1-acyl-sn-glycerol-3-phosphate acyltransferase